MRCCYQKSIFIIICLFCILLWCKDSFTQEETYVMDHQEIFTEMKRPPVHFPHTLHEEALYEEGCGVCHHIFDEQKGRLSYEEGEEQECASCHGLKKEAAKPSLREAFHKNCTGCHRLWRSK